MSHVLFVFENVFCILSNQLEDIVVLVYTAPAHTQHIF